MFNSSIMNFGKVGECHIITGCMFSGKSSETCKRVKKYQLLDKNVCIFNHCLDDNRYKEGCISTHDNINLPCISISNFDKIKDENKYDYNNVDVIVIEEAQFFGEDIVDFVKTAVEIDNKIVIITGLDGDSERINFGNIYKLIPFCESYKKLHALCLKCKNGTKASFTKCLVDKSSQILISSKDFIPVCRYHYLN